MGDTLGFLLGGDCMCFRFSFTCGLGAGGLRLHRFCFVLLLEVGFGIGSCLLFGCLLRQLCLVVCYLGLDV